MGLSVSEAPAPRPAVVERGLNTQYAATQAKEMRQAPSVVAQRMAKYVDQQLLQGTNPNLIIRSIAESAQIRPEQRAKFATMTERQQAEERIRQGMRVNIRAEQAKFIANEVIANGKFQRIDRGVMANSLATILDVIEQKGWDILVTNEPVQAEQYKDMPEIKSALERKQQKEEVKKEKQVA